MKLISLSILGICLMVGVVHMPREKKANVPLQYVSVSSQVQTLAARDTLPRQLLGNFTDDYGISYTVTDSSWIQHPNVRYQIIRCNSAKQYLIARNDDSNPSEGGRYTRIDYMSFTNMEPYRWGFCLTTYNAGSDTAAENTASADRENPRKGCGGFPFSRMKRKE